MISSVIDRFLESGWCSQPDPNGESSMTTANPLARYSAIWGRARERVRYAELHHHRGRDRQLPKRTFLTRHRQHAGTIADGGLHDPPSNAAAAADDDHVFACQWKHWILLLPAARVEPARRPKLIGA
jgi:hypothetical protein